MKKTYNNMNEAHKINRANNRKRRKVRRITELRNSKVQEIIRAKQVNREPDLAQFDAQISRLEAR